MRLTDQERLPLKRQVCYRQFSAGGSKPHPGGPPREAPQSVRRQEKQEECVGRKLHCVFLGKEWGGSVSRLRVLGLESLNDLWGSGLQGWSLVVHYRMGFGVISGRGIVYLSCRSPRKGQGARTHIGWFAHQRCAPGKLLAMS